MKKLLILMLVLGMASVANAYTLTWSADAVTLTLGVNGVVTLDVDAAGIWPSAKTVGADPSAVASIANILALPAAGPDAVVQDPTQTTYPGWWWVQAMDYEAPVDISSGPQFNVTLHPLALGTHALNSDWYGQNDVLEITVIPEPATIALLGFGGLFLMRRRKK